MPEETGGRWRHLVSTSEAATILGRSERTIRRQADTGEIPVVGRLGPQEQWVFRKEDLEQIATDSDN